MADFKPIETQEDFDKMIQKRLEQKEREVSERFKDYSSPEDVASIKADFEKKIKESEDAHKKDKETFEARANELAELKSRAEGAEKKLLKGKIAIEKGIPYELADRLVGDNEDEITKDAETVASYLGAKNAPPAFSHDNRSSGNGGNLDSAYMSLLGDLTK